MVLSDLAHSERIELLHPLFPKAFAYVKSNDLLHAPLGRIEVDGNRLYINNINPECVEASQQVLEAHRQYIDIHILLNGEEVIGWKSLDEVTHESKPYDAESDCALYKEPASTYVHLHPGQFLIVWPEDAHAPVIGSGKIRKLIVKVRL